MNDFFKNKKVLITGHTGFKGSWLTHYLLKYNSKICGVSLKPHTNPSIFKSSKLINSIDNHYVDINDQKKVVEIFNKFQPEIVFHLAAQPIVSISYHNPTLTFSTNVIGTLNVLEGLRKLKKCIAILITSDKCYENLEWNYGYREIDRLGGADPYSASKASAELLISSYVRSFFIKNKNIKIGIARAGNVIGGGDWSSNRIVPDCIRAWLNDKHVNIKNAKSTRPWQHVLDPLHGYLKFAFYLSSSNDLNGEPINFGPNSENELTVIELVKKLSHYWGKNKNIMKLNNSISNNEASLLKLNCDKALSRLNWKGKLSFEETIKITANWYKDFYIYKKNPTELIYRDIDFYEEINA